MIQEIRPAVRPAEAAIRPAAKKPSRVAALPGADRRITRKRLARPTRAGEKRPSEGRLAKS